MITPTIFFSRELYKEGQHQCYYCGSPCDELYTTKDYVKDTFTNRDIVMRPGSSYVCGGCVASLNERATITLIDGEVREGQRVRQYSWILTKDCATAATKRHISQLREIVICPPEPPFGIILSDSGQKHLMFRSRIAMSRESFPVMLEDEIIQVDPSLLSERIEFLKRLIAATGKPALEERYSTGFAIRLFELYGDRAEEMLEEFSAIKDEPLTRLALWLSPNKEDCTNELADRGEINAGRVSAKDSGAGEPDQDKGGGQAKPSRRSRKVLDDPGPTLFG